MAAADARAHAFDELCPVHGVRQAQRVEIALTDLGVGLRAAIGGLPTSPRGLGKWLARRIRRGAAFQLGPLTHWSPARPPSAPTTLLRLKQTEQHVVICTSERAKQRSVGRSALHNKCFPPAAVTTLQ